MMPVTTAASGSKEERSAAITKWWKVIYSILFLFIGSILLLFLLLSFDIDLLKALLSRILLAVGGRGLLLKMGCPGGLALVLSFAWKALNGIVLPELVCCMDDDNTRGWTSIFESSSGGNSIGSSEGSVNQPVPNSPEPPAPLNPEVAQPHPNSNHYPSGSSQEAHQGGVGKRKLFAVLHKHLRKYCASPDVARKFPYLKEEDLEYFTQHIAISELDIEGKPDIEIAALAHYIQNYKRVKTLYDLFFEAYFKEDD